MSEEDEVIYSVSPSQWINIGWIIFGVVGFMFVIPPLIALYKMLDVGMWRYDFHASTIIERRGVFSVTRKEVFYYRIKSISLYEPFLYRIFGLSRVNIITSDPYVKEITLVALENGLQMRSIIRESVEIHRNERGMKEHDLYQL